jgi:hypothetical protein
MTDFKLHFKKNCTITFHCTAKEKEIEVVLIVPSPNQVPGGGGYFTSDNEPGGIENATNNT